MLIAFAKSLSHGWAVPNSCRAPKLYFSMQPEDQPSGPPIRMKVEINTRERTGYDEAQAIVLAVKNPWFTGNANIQTFSKEEILATKLRALLQGEKGRDLVDLAHANSVFGDLDHARVVTLGKYLEASKQAISRAQADERMFAKLDDRAITPYWLKRRRSPSTTILRSRRFSKLSQVPRSESA